MHIFLSKILLIIFPSIKLFNGVIFKKSIEQPKSFSFCLDDVLVFPELLHQYELFKNMPKLDISIVTNCSSLEELKVLLTSFRFPAKW